MTKDAAAPQQYWNNRSHGENLSLTLGKADIMMQYFFTKSTIGQHSESLFCAGSLKILHIYVANISPISIIHVEKKARYGCSIKCE
jgi:hypothetical protein